MRMQILIICDAVLYYAIVLLYTTSAVVLFLLFILTSGQPILICIQIYGFVQSHYVRLWCMRSFRHLR